MASSFAASFGMQRHGDGGVMLFAELGDVAAVINLHTTDFFTDQFRVYVEHADKLESAGGKVHVLGDGTAQIAGADQNGLTGNSKAQDFADFFVKGFYIVAVALLAESAEAV